MTQPTHVTPEWWAEVNRVVDTLADSFEQRSPGWKKRRLRYLSDHNTAPDKPNQEPPAAVNTDAAAERAIHYLTKDAPEAIEGAAGDETTLVVANRVLDYGVDESQAVELMLDHWNDRCSPPWRPEDLAVKVGNAARYRHSRIGSASPEAQFGVVETPKDVFEPKPGRPPFEIKPLARIDPAAIPPRDWILGRHILGTKVSVMIAPPGAGKSTYSLAMGLAVATGRDDVCGLKPHQTGSVLAINNEDDEHELSRRLCALTAHHKIDFDDVVGKLYLHSGVTRPFLMARRTLDGVVVALDKDALTEHIRTLGVRLVIVDPFLETHRVSENSNEEINQVARMYREVAQDTGCAILLVHHTRKAPAGSTEGHAGNMDSGRGASSLTGVARIVTTLYGMSGKDAVKYGVPEIDRHKYVRLDDAKANLSLTTNRARWFCKTPVALPNGDEVGVLAPIELREQIDDMMQVLGEVAQDMISKRGADVTVSELAQAVIDQGSIAGLGDSRPTVIRNIKKLLADPIEVAGWRVWYLEDPRTTGKGTVRYWVTGHTTADAE